MAERAVAQEGGAGSVEEFAGSRRKAVQTAKPREWLGRTPGVEAEGKARREGLKSRKFTAKIFLRKLQ